MTQGIAMSDIREARTMVNEKLACGHSPIVCKGLGVRPERNSYCESRTTIALFHSKAPYPGHAAVVHQLVERGVRLDLKR
jgi:hypothetical protein